MPIISNGKQFVLYGHRHDQSILRIRHKLPTVLKTWELYEFRSLEHAQKNKSHFYNHHGGYEFIQFTMDDMMDMMDIDTTCIDKK